MLLPKTLIFNFDKGADINAWQVVDDVVMGGRSSGSFSLNEEGHGVFHGTVSLENNGGFSSVRYPFDKVPVEKAATAVLKIKGDGKSYQFRVKHNQSDYYSYITTFQTSGEWETIEIPFKELYPSFRGRTLDMPNFNHESIEELTFLIANKKAQDFKLLIDKIEVK